MTKEASSRSKIGRGEGKSEKMEKRASSKTAENSTAGMSANPVMSTVTDVTSDDLKNRFAAGSIPLQQDFSNLVDIAECGRRASGQSKDQTNNSVGVGLALATDSDNIGKISVKAGNGITSDSSGVSVKVYGSDGIVADGGGLKIRRGGCITVDSNGIAVKCGNGIDYATDHVCVKAGHGIVVDESGVSIDPKNVLPKGMIMMFSGSTIPDGWVLCDGGNGTPDLRGRFILGGALADIGGKNGKPLSGDKNSKTYSQTSSSVKTGIGVKVNDFTLTEDHIPAHNHWSGTARDGDGDLCALYGSKMVGFSGSYKNLAQTSYREFGSGDYFQVTSSKTGNGKAHAHSTTVSESSHNHTVEIIPPYYILVFVMKN